MSIVLFFNKNVIPVYAEMTFSKIFFAALRSSGKKRLPHYFTISFSGLPSIVLGNENPANFASVGAISAE